jgi:hypothetical protein
MKKFATFVMIVGLGLFCVIGCSGRTTPPPVQPVQPVVQPGGAGPAKPATPDAAKPGEKKPGDQPGKTP